MTLDSWKSLFEVVGVLAAGIAFASGVGVLWTGNAMSKRDAAEKAEAAREMAEIRAANADRELKPSHRKSLINAFKAKKGALVIVSPMMNREAQAFADQIDEAFRAATWDTLRIKNWLGIGSGVSMACFGHFRG